LRVAHPAIGQLGDVAEGGFLGIDFLGLGNFLKTRDNLGIVDRAKLEALAAGDDGREHLLAFRCRKDEFDVRRGFLKGFEESVEGRLREHVHLVDDVDLVGALGRAVLAVLAQVAHLLHGVVGGPVDLNHVYATAGHDRLNEVGLRVEIDSGLGGPVKRAGQQAGGAGLSGAAWADEQIGVGEPLPLNRIGERADDVFLPYEVAKTPGPPPTGNDLISTFHRSTLERTSRGGNGK